MSTTTDKKHNLIVTIPVRFPPGVAAALKAFAAHADRPMSRVIRAAVREYLERSEKKEQGQ